MSMIEWMNRWGLPPEAVQELYQVLGVTQESSPIGEGPGISEAAVQAHVRVEASEKGIRLWRNNVGATLDSRGRMIRYGLCNDSKRMNESMKSSDLVGIKPIYIGPEHVGKTFGQFTAREVKHSGWEFKGTLEERAQLSWMSLVSSLGGDAKFCSGEGSF